METERGGQAEREGDRDRFINIYGSQGPNIYESFVIIQAPTLSQFQQGHVTDKSRAFLNSRS